MATIPRSHPALSLSLSDSLLTPLLSSASDGSSIHTNGSVAAAQQDLQSTSLTVYATARRLGLGKPLRVMIETANNGPVVLQSYISPPSVGSQSKDGADAVHGMEDIIATTRHSLQFVSSRTIHQDTDNDPTNGAMLADTPENNDSEDVPGQDDVPQSEEGLEDTDEEESGDELSKVLVATAVGPSSRHLRDARRAIAKLEKLGTEFQQELNRQAEESRRIESEGVTSEE